jgi:hypothetical protein
MADIDLYPGDNFVDTDIFVVVENEDYDFVTVDEDVPYAPIIIDMSDNEFAEAIIIDFEENTGLDDFVTIDEDPIFISGFEEDDLI